MIQRILFVIAALLALAIPSQATFSLVQHPDQSCGTVSSCAITVSATGNKNLLVAAFVSSSSGVTISSVSGAGTWALCPTSNCASLRTDEAYNLSSTSGVTSITVNLSSSANNVRVHIFEYSFTAAAVAFDNGGNTSGAGTTTQLGVALTLTGTNDAIVQVAWGGVGSATAISSPYTDPADFPAGIGFAGAINTASGTAPTWTFSASGGTNFFSGLAIKETGLAASKIMKSKMGGPSKWD